jgi:hypothetical protein
MKEQGLDPVLFGLTDKDLSIDSKELCSNKKPINNNK